MKPRITALCLLAVAACSPVTGPLDAGAPDAALAWLDAGSVDAGAVVPDASLDAGADAGPADGGEPLTYVDDVVPLFERTGCSTFGCHGGVVAGAGGLVYLPDAPTGWLDMVNRVSFTDGGLLVKPGHPDDSVLVTHAETRLISLNVLVAADTQLIRTWVADGALYSRTGAPDAGTFTTDAGNPVACTLELSRGSAPLPAACLPRCTAATWNEVVACRSQPDVFTRQQNALNADPTQSINIPGGEDDVSMNCGQCLDWQTRSCMDELCRFELLAVDRCNIFGGNCAPLESVLQNCTSTPTFLTCQRARDPLCAG